MPNRLTPLYSKNHYKKKELFNSRDYILKYITPPCYGPSVISVTVTTGGHPRGNRLYRTSRTIGRGVSRVT